MGELVSLRGALVLSLTGIFMILGLKKPKFGVIAFLILLFLRDAFLFNWFPPIYINLRLPFIFGILTLISWIIHSKEFSPQFPIQLWLMLSFFIVIFLSRLFAGTGIASKSVSEFFKLLILFFLIINTVRTKNDLSQIIWVLILVNTFSVLYHYYYYKIGSLNTIFYRVIVGTLNRNDFGAILVSICPLTYFTFMANKKILIKAILIFCFFFLIVGIILTNSRGGSLAIAVTLFITALLDRQRIKFIFIFLILLILIGSRISENYIVRMQGISEYENDASSMGRIVTYHAAMNMFSSSPILGVGADNFNGLFWDYVPYGMHEWAQPGKSVHNVVLQVLSETGIVGISIFSMIIISSFIDIFKVTRFYAKRPSPDSLEYIGKALGLGFFGYIVALQFTPGAYYSYIYIFVPLITAAKLIYKKHYLEIMEKSENVYQGQDSLMQIQ